MLNNYLIIFAFFLLNSAPAWWCAAAADDGGIIQERYSLPIAMNARYYGHQSDNNKAQAIPLNAFVPPTLQQAYGDDAQRSVALALDFAQQPYRWDPYNRLNQSEFIWRYSDTNGTTLPADNAFIDLSGATPYAPYKFRKAALISAPFQRWQPLPSDDTNSTAQDGVFINPYDEGVLQWNKSVIITATERILLRFKSLCKVLNAEKHPYSSYLVSHPDDDPRLANCFIILEPYSANATTAIYVLVTNKSIWGVQGDFQIKRNRAALSRNDVLFGSRPVYQTAVSISKRRIGIRQSYNDVVDVGLEYNALSNQYTFYVSGQPTWLITQPGLAPLPDGVTKTDALGTGGPGVAESEGLEFGIRFGTHKCLDESDPWNQTDTTLLVRHFSDPAYYAPNAMFYDNENMRSSSLWGQTVKMTLQKVLIVTASAVVQPTTPVGGGQYSSSSSADDNNNNNDYQPLASSSSSSAASNHEDDNDDNNYGKK